MAFMARASVRDLSDVRDLATTSPHYELTKRNTMSHITRLLIANRGEIATRIAATARRLGITSIAVYSEADRSSLHARSCDERYSLGKSDSYLDLENILTIAKECRADAIHPGYGFLSENELFPERAAQEGIRFIGPSASAMLQLGSKALAKKLAIDLSIPVIPGAVLDDLPLDEAVEQSSVVGFPLIVKASFGGGGRGMRVVTDRSQLRAALESAGREAATFFSRGDVFVERYLTDTRHIEVQVLGDGKGRAVSLGDRDCSLQRNHQKVIEEAPAPFIGDQTRIAIHDAACRLFATSHYQGVGTAEFLLSPTGEFFFLEANTRLQVEHPVTEAIFGIDLVEYQIRVAEGVSIDALRLPVHSDGYSIEARLCAEIPELAFVASTGILDEFRYPIDLPSGSRLRVDTGFVSGDRVTHLYDSLLAKIVVRAASREEAITDLVTALRSITVNGIRTNRNYLLSLLGDSDFRHCRHHTRTAHAKIPQEHTYARLLFDAAASYWKGTFATALTSVDSASRWRSLVPTARRLDLEIDGEVVTTAVSPTAAGWVFTASWREHKDKRPLVSCSSDAAESIESSDILTSVYLDTAVCSIKRAYPKIPRPHDTLAGTLDLIIKAPLPGRVIKICVAPGAEVGDNETVIILESMKMEHQITAHREGVVRVITVSEGQTVDRDAPLLELA